MVFYHFCWDLGEFGVLNRLTVNSGGWRLFAQAIGSSFLFISGLSFWLFWIYNKSQRHFLHRFAKLLIASVLVTIGSFVAYGEYFIFFGILHLLTVCTLVGVFLVRLPLWFLFIFSIFVASFANYFSFEIYESRLFYWVGLDTGFIGTVDFYPFFPWAAPYVLGLVFGKIIYRHRFLQDGYAGIAKKDSENKKQYTILLTGAKRALIFLSSYALYIYLIHQPIFFGLIILALNII